MRGKTRNIAIQRVLQQYQQQCCRTSCTFFLARFPVPLCTSLRRFRRETSVSIRKKYRLEPGVGNSLPLRENSRERFVLKPKFSGDLFFFINKRSIFVAVIRNTRNILDKWNALKQSFLAFLEHQKFVANICFFEQLFYRKKSFGALPVNVTFQNSFSY